MDAKNLIIYIFKCIIIFLPLAQSWWFVEETTTQSPYTDLPELNNTTAQSPYIQPTELNNLETATTYTDIKTDLNNIETVTPYTYLPELNNLDTVTPYTGIPELNNLDTVTPYTGIPELNNLDTAPSYTYPTTELSSIATETEWLSTQQNIIVNKNIGTEADQLSKSYGIIVKNDTIEEKLNKVFETEQLSKPQGKFIKNDTEIKQLSKPYGKFVKNDTKTDQLNKPYQIFVKNFKNNIKPNPPVFYNSPPEYNPNLSKTPNYSPFLNLKGKYCETRPGSQCCPNRQDDCSVPVLGTLCYCDHFCDRTPNKKITHASPDCCPDFYSVCTKSSTVAPPSGWSLWSMCSKTCGVGEEMRSRITNNGKETERRPCLVSRCPIPPQTQCGGLYRSASGTIDYPAGSNNYPNGANCRWIIATQPYSTIEISIVSFSTQRQHDYLTIREHNISTFSANMSGSMEGVISTASNIVTLFFTSDDSVTDSGFIIKWKEMLAPSLSVEVWMCRDAWGKECIFDKEDSNGGLVCNCKDAQARGWCKNDYRSTRRVCEATCNPLCTPDEDVVTKDNFKLKQEKKTQKDKEGNLKNLLFTDSKKN